MLTPLLIVAVLFSGVKSDPPKMAKWQSDTTRSLPSGQVEGLNSSTLQYVYAFFRHGVRAPTAEPYPTDPNRFIFHQHFSQLGELTTTGIQQMFEMGKRLSGIYGDFVGDFSVEKVRASSTNKSRAIMSAQSMMAGMFPPKIPLLKTLEKWQPIPIWQDYAEYDKTYLFNDPNFPKLALEQCPRYGEMIEKGYNIIKAKDQNPSRKVIYELLQQETGRADVNSINIAGFEIYDILEMEELNGLKLPEWATKPQPALGHKPLYPDLMRPILNDWFYTAQWLNRDPQMLLFYSGPLFYDINKKFKEKTTINENKELFRYHNTHDHTLITLRWALGFDDPNFEIEVGDGIAFELHKLEGRFVVQVVYYHSNRGPAAFREVLQLPDCPSPCPYDLFSKKYQSLSPEEWEEECKVKTINIQ